MDTTNKKDRKNWNSKFRSVVELTEWLHENFDKLSKEEIMNEIVSVLKKNGYDVSKAEEIYKSEKIYLKNKNNVTD